MLSFLARRARPCDVSAPETAKAPPTPRAVGERPKRSGGPRRGENLQRSGREEAGLSGRGNSWPAEVGGGACGIQRSKRRAGTGLPNPRGSEHRASARSTSPVDSGHRTAPNLQSCARRRASATLDGDNPGPGSMPIRAPLSKPELRADGANQRDREFLRSPRPRTRPERPLSARLGDLGQGNGKGRDAPNPAVSLSWVERVKPTQLRHWPHASGASAT